MGIVLLAFVQFLSVSFELSFDRVKIALFETHDSDYQTVQQEWVLYQSYLFDVAGPPRRENWQHQEIAEEIRDARVIGFVPDQAHFHPLALKLSAFREGRSLEVIRLGETSDSADTLGSLEFVVGKTGFQGLSYVTGFNDVVYRQLEEQGWLRVKSWDLPDQTQALLWRHPEKPRSE